MPDSDTPHDTSEKRAGSDTTASRFLIPETEQVQVEFGATTDVGHVRARNEDHYAIIRRQRSREIVSTNVDLRDVGLPHDESYLLIVADGAGGEGFGHLASQLVVRTAWETAGRAANWLMRLADADAAEIKDRVVAYAKLIQQAFLSYTHDHPRVAGMATTWTCAYVTDSDVIVAHVGDSRAYHATNGKLRQVTHDHTLAEELLKSGASPDEVARFRNVLTRAFGGDGQEVIPDVHQLRLHDGDALLLCSDGLTGVVRDEEIAATLFARNSAQEACDQLIQLALERGGPDNVTALVLRVLGSVKRENAELTHLTLQ